MTGNVTRDNSRRGFLRGAAGLAGAAPFAPLLAAASAQGAESGQQGVAAGQTRKLAEYASALRYEDIPPAVVQHAKDAIADTVATIMYGGELPWSKMIATYARHNGPGGNSRILGLRDALVHAPAAALANGAFAHAFELDNLTKPNSGSHPGATILSSSLAVAQESGATGRELVTAFVAGAEVMIRIGVATKHSQEEHGYHAPGTTGPFGAAVATARVMRLDADQTQNAIGIAASTASGLLEFAKSGTGAMVKRLHLGRAAESGVLAASLAAEGFTGPVTAIEGEFGFLRVFCRDYDMNALTRGLGETWSTQSIMMKRYACHITAHTPVEGTLALKVEHKFRGEDVADIAIQSTERAVRVNNIPQPRDILLAQYSIPFCVALAMYRNPVDPRSFDESALRSPEIMGLAARVKMSVLPPPDNRSDMTSIVTISLKDGRSVSRRTTAFTGTPERPLGQEELREKFLMLTRQFGEADMARTFARLQNLENEKSVDWIGA
jgi:2-methylcitrate dehydratase PrpD